MPNGQNGAFARALFRPMPSSSAQHIFFYGIIHGKTASCPCFPFPRLPDSRKKKTFPPSGRGSTKKCPGLYSQLNSVFHNLELTEGAYCPPTPTKGMYAWKQPLLAPPHRPPRLFQTGSGAGGDCRAHPRPTSGGRPIRLPHSTRRCRPCGPSSLFFYKKKTCADPGWVAPAGACPPAALTTHTNA